MIFTELYIHNFFSFGEGNSIPLKDQGLVLISGDNKDSEAASSNGSGKSSIAEALIWCLWGTTVRGQSGDEVINRKVGKNCLVKLRIEHEGVEYVIIRHRKYGKEKNDIWFQQYLDEGPISLSEGTSSATQTKINEFLGIDYDTFIRGPMMPQGSFKRFSEMTNAESWAVLEQALQIGIFKQALKETKIRLSSVHSRLTEIQSNILAKEDDLDRITHLMTEYRTNQQTWDEDKRKTIANLRLTLADLETKEDILINAISLMDTQCDLVKLNDDLDAIKYELDSKRKELSTKENSIRDQLNKAKSESYVLSDRIKQANGKKKSILQLASGSLCPTCSQSIDASHVGACITDLNKVIEENNNEFIKINNNIQNWETSFKKVLKSHEAIINQLETSRSTKEKERTKALLDAKEYEAKRDKLDEIEKSKQYFRKQIEDEKKKESAFDKLIFDTSTELDEKLIDLGNKKAIAKGLQIEKDHLEFWEEGFSNKGLKSLIMQSVIPFLNQRVSRYAQSLTGNEIQISFDTTATLKSGETRDQFSTSVVNRNGASSYAGNSGGEKSRVDLSINFAFSDLVASRSKKSFPQRFFDEPFESLDEAGVEAAMNFLRSMVKDAGTIFVVTHKEGMKGLFDKTLTLVKENGFTSCI